MKLHFCHYLYASQVAQGPGSHRSYFALLLIFLQMVAEATIANDLLLLSRTNSLFTLDRVRESAETTSLFVYNQKRLRNEIRARITQMVFKDH